MNSTALQDTETARRDRATQPWLNHVPSGWTRKRIKWAAPQVLKKSTDSSRTPVALESVESFTGRLLAVEGVDLADGTGIDFEPGDVLFGKLRPYLAKSLTPDFVGRCTGEMLVMRPKEVTPEYLKYLTLSYPFVETVNASTFGSKMPRADWRFVGNLLAPYPSRKAQTDIVAYLDGETKRIDTIIEKNRRLLELIDEKRTAFISHALTQGLSDNPPLKSSGVRCLGEIAEGWTPLRLKFLKKVGFQYGANEAALSEDASQPRFIRITDLNSDGTLRDDTFRSLPENLAAPYILQDEDILFARSGATVGKAFRYRSTMGRACFAGYLISFRADHRKVLPAFVELFTQSLPYWEQVRAGLIQATIQNVSAERYADMWLAIPPIKEQPELIDKITERLKEFSKIAGKVTRAIDLLRERRLTLISAAVTGQLEVPTS